MISEAEHQRRLAEYNRGLSDTQIGMKLNLSPAAVASWRHAFSLKPNRRKRPVCPRERAEILELHSRGYQIAAISQATGRSRTCVRDVIHAHTESALAESGKNPEGSTKAPDVVPGAPSTTSYTSKSFNRTTKPAGETQQAPKPLRIHLDYTMDDMVAMATARNCSYGDIQKHLEFGCPIPPLVRSTVWPKGSRHAGEDQLPSIWEEPKPEPPKVTIVSPSAFCGRGNNKVYCSRCATQARIVECYKVFLHKSGDASGFGSKYANLCPRCRHEFLPASQPKMMEMEILFDEDGKRVPIRHIGRCGICGKIHRKKLGAQVFVSLTGSAPRLVEYLCPDCVQSWKNECKKTSPPPEKPDERG